MNTETRAFLYSALSGVFGHFCYTLLPPLTDHVIVLNPFALYISILSVLAWLFGAKLKSRLGLLVVMPLLWAITSFCHLSSHFRDDLKGKEEVIVIGMKPIETMADAFPTSLIFLMILSLTLYLITTLHWLHLTKKPRVRLSDNKNLDIVKADPKNPYPLSAIFFIYWGLACPLGISAWGGISPPVENLMTKDLLTLALGGVWLAALMPLILGASFVLLYASPPSLIYLEERGLLQLSHRWRSWAWLLFIVGVSLILFAL